MSCEVQLQKAPWTPSESITCLQKRHLRNRNITTLPPKSYNVAIGNEWYSRRGGVEAVLLAVLFEGMILPIISRGTQKNKVYQSEGADFEPKQSSCCFVENFASTQKAKGQIIIRAYHLHFFNITPNRHQYLTKPAGLGPTYR